MRSHSRSCAPTRSSSSAASARNLGELTGAGFPVPPGFAVTTRRAYRARRHRRGGRRGLRGARAAGRSRRPAGRRPLERDRRGHAATRASPACRTPTSGSAASTPCSTRVRRCWASFHNPEAVAYREAHGIERGGMSVGRAVHGRRARRGRDVHAQPRLGRSLVDRDRRELRPRRLGRRRRRHARLVPGLEGDARDRPPADRREGDRGRRRPGGRDDGHARGARGAARAAVPRATRRSAGWPRSGAASRRTTTHPQDVEWAIDRQLGELFILQSRPETVWSQQAAARSPSRAARWR